MQQFLKPAVRAAGAGVVAAQPFDELLVAVHDAMTALDPRFGWESLATLTRDLETSTGRGVFLFVSWRTSIDIPGISGTRIIGGQKNGTPRKGRRGVPRKYNRGESCWSLGRAAVNRRNR